MIAIDRGNNEIIVFLCTALFIYFLQKNKGFAACMFLSIAMAMKLFPAVFLVLLFSEKKYKEIAITVGLTLLLSIMSVSLFANDFSDNINFILSGFGVTNAPLFGDNNVLQRGVSAFVAIKLFLVKADLLHSMRMHAILSAYSVVCLTVFGLLSLYIWLIEREFWKKLTLLVLPMLLFPQVSAEYKLLYIYLPLYLFVNHEKRSVMDLFYLLMLALMLVPKDYLYFQGFITDSGYADYSINSVLNIAIMIMVMTAMVITGFMGKKASKYAIKKNKNSGML
jgi:hypothetical protein